MDSVKETLRGSVTLSNVENLLAPLQKPSGEFMKASKM